MTKVSRMFPGSLVGEEGTGGAPACVFQGKAEALLRQRPQELGRGGSVRENMVERI